MKAAFLPGSMDGCALWRFFMPHLKIPESKFVYNPGYKLPIEALVQVDVVVVQRLGTYDNLAAIKLIHSMGKKIIYDLDDNLWNLPSWNPAYSAKFSRIRDLFSTCIKECDLVVVSTNPLQAAMRRNVEIKVPVEVIHNAVDFDLFHPLPKLDRDTVTVGWGGSPTHDKDIA